MWNYFDQVGKRKLIQSSRRVVSMNGAEKINNNADEPLRKGSTKTNISKAVYLEYYCTKTLILFVVMTYASKIILLYGYLITFILYCLVLSCIIYIILLFNYKYFFQLNILYIYSLGPL
jgi:hypothetical protein